VAVLLIALAAAGATVASLSFRRAMDARDARDLAASLARPPLGASFDPAALAGLPEPARRYLSHALAPGTVPAASAHVAMTGRFRLGADWLPMEAGEWLAPDGFLWDAAIQRGGTAVRVWDGLGPDGGFSRVWLLGVVPLARTKGPDVTRAAAGRLAAELIWLPEALLPGGATDARWAADGPDGARVRVVIGDTELTVHLRLARDGAVQAVWLERWGDPDGSGAFSSQPFGAEAAGEAAFAGHTIPSRLSAGWGYGTDAFAPFFEATVTGADYSGG
jgi:hypothetical protein